MDIKTSTKLTQTGSSNWSRVFIGLALIAAIFAVSSWLTHLTVPLVGRIVNEESFAEKNFITKSFMLIFTLIAMRIVGNKISLNYGFVKGEHLDYGRFTKQAVLLSVAGLFSLILLNVINFAITKRPPVGFPDESIVNRILFIWIWSSLVEEILFRGLFQSLIGEMNRIVFTFKKAHISLAVLLSGLAFATLHLSLLIQGMSTLFVAGIFINTLLLGLQAAYLREKTRSIYPAIYVHILFNVIGSAPLLLSHFLNK